MTAADRIVSALTPAERLQQAEEARDRARADWDKAEEAARAARAAWFEAAEEALRLGRLSEPLDQLLLHFLIDFSGPTTPAKAAQYTYRSRAEVEAELQRLAASPVEWFGKRYMISRDGKRYTAVPLSAGRSA